MPHSDMKKAIKEIARIFEVSYQRAWTRTQTAIKNGLILSIAVVRDEVDSQAWAKMGFKPVWRPSGRSSGGAGVEVAATPGRIHLRGIGLDDSPELSFSQEAMRDFIASVKR